MTTESNISDHLFIRSVKYYLVKFVFGNSVTLFCIAVRGRFRSRKKYNIFIGPFPVKIHQIKYQQMFMCKCIQSVVTRVTKVNDPDNVIFSEDIFDHLHIATMLFFIIRFVALNV